MPQYPPPQYQYYGNSINNPGFNHGVGYSSTYYGGGNSDRYHSSYSSIHNTTTSTSTTSSGTQGKTVCRMDCRYCSAVVCLRGMKAMLLADTSVELYSTDHPPGSVQLIDKDYTTSNCKCKIRDVACQVCGNVIGYHITQPCQQCLKAPNNGHFWMFHTDGVVGQERMNMDLGKLVQELVKFPHSAAAGGAEGVARRAAGLGFGARYVSTAAGGGGPPPSQPIVLTTAAAAAAAADSTVATTATATVVTDPRNDAATTRATSLSRLQRQQRLTQTTYQPPAYPPPPLRIISTSPTPTTPTPTTPTPSTRNPLPPPPTATPEQHQAAPEPPISMGLSATAALMNLTLSQFLQPMKWEQLPHPDLDIDLDPNTMGGEPLFAGDWMELVGQIAETAVANMSLALDQEEETERYMARMMEEHRQRLVQQDLVERGELESESGSSGASGNVSGVREGRSEGEDGVVELIPEDGNAVSSAGSAAGTGHAGEREQVEDEEGMDELIDRVGEVALASPPHTTALDELKEEDEDMDMNGEPTGRGRTFERRQRDADGVPAVPGQDPSSLSSSIPAAESNHRRRSQNTLSGSGGGIVTGAPPLHDNTTQQHRRRNSSSSDSSSASSDRTAYFSPESCPAMVLTSAMIAKASASAAAADAATAANNLLFGRRSRRDYDMMCR
ncbi:Protein fam72a [Mortierella sp. NVP41]|nr:Protein fam72a [Mortierella sp. NVP41]